MKLLISLLFLFHSAFAGLPPTTSKVSGDATGAVTFKYEFPNFTGTRSGVTTTLNVNGVSGGGTGVATIPTGQVVLGAGTGPVTTVAPSTTGNILTSNGSTWVSQAGASGGVYSTVGPTAQQYTSGTTHNLMYAFIITAGSATVGATYTNNAITYTVYATVASATLVYMSGSGAPSASGTLTKASGTGDATLTFSLSIAPSYLRVDMVGGGGGGGGSGTGTSGGAGGNGGTTTFGTSLLTATGGVGGSNYTAGAGGTGTISSPAINIGSFDGQYGRGGETNLVGQTLVGGDGGSSNLGIGGNGTISGAAPASGYGAGGAGGTGGSSINSGAGGASGASVSAIIPPPLSATYTISIGALGSAGAAGTSGLAAAVGTVGVIFVTSYFPNSSGAGDMVLATDQNVTGAKRFSDSKLFINGATSGNLLIHATAIAGSSDATFPTGTTNVATLETAQTFGTGLKQFADGKLALNGATSSYTLLRSAAIAASSDITLPAGTDTLVGLAAVQSVTGAKTFSAAKLIAPDHTFSSSTAATPAAGQVALYVTSGDYLSKNQSGDITKLVRSYNATMTGTQASTSTTMADVTELVTPVIPAGTYQWECEGAYQTAATTTGIGMRLVAGTSTMTRIFGMWNFRQAVDGVASMYTIAQLDQTLAAASASVIAATTNYPLSGVGYFTLSVAGTVKAQFATEVAASAATLAIGTNCSVRSL